MNIFDLLFLALVLTTVLTLLIAGGFAVAGRCRRSLRVLKRLGVGASVYFFVVIFVSLLSPRREYQLGEPQCFDDWCIAASGAHKVANAAGDEYQVDFQISSRAKRISQRELNMTAYLTDRENRRYDPVPQPSDVSFGTVLGPGEAVQCTRLFRLPPGVRDVNLVIAHQGGFPIGWFIIGYDTWFRKPPLVRLNIASS